jgi:retron-type reverse transcriptase
MDTSNALARTHIFRLWISYKKNKKRGDIMPYLTYEQAPMYHQITFDEIISGKHIEPLITCNRTNTRTYFRKSLEDKFLKAFDFNAMIDSLENFVSINDSLYKERRESLYDTFYIPKKTGGLREINAPEPQLMEALRNLKSIFETQMYAKYHTSAFAYVPHRSTIDMVKRHQRNDSRWFLKTDFSNFFGSTTPKFVMEMLSIIFPFSEIVRTERGKTALTQALDLCFLHGGLPQGTPISPMLTNLVMIPIDHRLCNCLRNYHGNSYVYTRYADDISISSRRSFDYKEIVQLINETLFEFNAPFSIKEEKTRYGSRAGSNWNLGVMLNKDNEITIGHKNKKRFRAMVNNYILDRQNGKSWDLHDVQVLSGHISYYRMVESSYVDHVIDYNNQKYNTDLMAIIKSDLSCA